MVFAAAAFTRIDVGVEDVAAAAAAAAAVVEVAGGAVAVARSLTRRTVVGVVATIAPLLACDLARAAVALFRSLDAYVTSVASVATGLAEVLTVACAGLILAVGRSAVVVTPVVAIIVSRTIVCRARTIRRGGVISNGHQDLQFGAPVVGPHRVIASPVPAVRGPPAPHRAPTFCASRGRTAPHVSSMQPHRTCALPGNRQHRRRRCGLVPAVVAGTAAALCVGERDANGRRCAHTRCFVLKT